jgi:transcriptional regulator with XRE-family HTH domain
MSIMLAMAAEEQELAARLGANVRQLREARGMTQEQMARLSSVPRATWSNMESGTANPTLTVLHRIARALQVPLEELTSTPRSSGRLHRRETLAVRKQGDGQVRKLLPDSIPGVILDRMELPPGGRIPGVPHMAGTREYLTCEVGTIVLAAAGEQWQLQPGDVLSFRGDQKHSYSNPGDRVAVAYSVVLLSPMA